MSEQNNEIALDKSGWDKSGSDKPGSDQPGSEQPAPDQPALNEQALARLLEAAYVLQEHNRAQAEREQNRERQSAELRQREKAAHATRPAAPIAPGPQPPAPSAAPRAADNYTSTLAQIVKTQHQIQVRHLDLEAVLALVAERAAEMEQASGAGIAVLDQQTVCYRAASGPSALAAGTRIPMEKALSSACLRSGQAMRCGDVNPEFLLDAEECQQRGIQALLAVPVYHDGEVIGALEIYFADRRTFSDQDVDTGQLMAGLLTEAFARDDEATWKKSLAAERATMLDALERLKPDLAALAESAQAVTGAAPVAALTLENTACWKCANALMAQEQFCGKCGSPRAGDNGAASLQSKLATLWHQQQEQESGTNAPSVSGNGSGDSADAGLTGHIPGHPDIPSALDPADLARLQTGELFEGQATENHQLDSHTLDSTDPFIDPELEKQIQQMVETLAAKDAAQNRDEDMFLRPDRLASLTEIDPAGATPSAEISEELTEEKIHGEAGENPEASTALVKTEDDPTWSSAAKAKDFFEQLAATRGQGPLAHFWKSRRGDIYLAVAVVLVAVVIRWGIWSNHSVGASGGGSSSSSQTRRRPAPDADLSFFDKMMINLGLAEAPEAPEYKGNPDAQVWVDTRAALYYCQGADLYGKTPKGKLTSQRDAQLDQVEPAYRKPCD